MAAGGAIAAGATSPWAVETLLDRLTGVWTFEREIDNGVTVAGRATFAPADDGRLAYAEQGRMRLPAGAELDAHAGYLFDLAGDRLTMLFPEAPPRLFQSFVLEVGPEGLVGESVHACPPDTYRSHIAFDADGSWGLAHAVRGPRKRYVSQTRYRRALDLTAI